jgi:hypothetical protein
LKVFGQKTWAALNSQFSLWAISGLAAVIGTVITMAYSDVKNCRKDFDDLRDQYERASNEVWARFERFFNALNRDVHWSDQELLDFLDKQEFRREFRDWKYMDVELEADRVLRRIKTIADVGGRACRRGHECSVQQLSQKLRGELAADLANPHLRMRDKWIHDWYPLSGIREYENLQIVSKCSMRNSLDRILSFR